MGCKDFTSICYFRIVARKNGKEIISRHHAEILFVQPVGEPLRYIVKDIGALNGIYVNNRRISTHVLSHGDIIQFGGFYNMAIGATLTVSDVSVRYKYQSSTRATATTTPPIIQNALKRKVEEPSSESSLRGRVASAIPPTDASHVAKRVKINAPESHVNNIPSLSKSAQNRHEDEVHQLQSRLSKLEKEHDETVASLEQALLKKGQQVETLQVQVTQLELKCEEQRKLLRHEELSAQRREREEKDRIDARAQQDEFTRRKALREKEKEREKYEELCRSLERERGELTIEQARVREREKQLREAEHDRERQREKLEGLFVQKLRSQLLCVLCAGPLVEMVLLRCSHGFCRSCLEGAWRKQLGELTCPACGHVVVKHSLRMKHSSSQLQQVTGVIYLYFPPTSVFLNKRGYSIRLISILHAMRPC